MRRLLPLALLACSLPRAEADRATVCLLDSLEAAESGELLDIAPGESLEIFVHDALGCHNEDIEVSCTAEVVGDAIFVTTETSWTRVKPLATSCEAVLFTTAGSCTTSAPLEEGTYTLHYGEQSLVVEVPGTPDETCLFPATPAP